jgi:hypothetical protein
LDAADAVGMIFKAILALSIGFVVHHGVQHYWLTSMTAQVTVNSGLQLLPPAPAFPTIEVDPEKMRLAINPPVTIDTQKYQRLAIESMSRDIVRQNDEALSRARAATIPPYIPGLRH